MSLEWRGRPISPGWLDTPAHRDALWRMLDPMQPHRVRQRAREAKKRAQIRAMKAARRDLTA